MNPEAPMRCSNCSGRHSLCSCPQTRRRLSAQAAPPSAVAELGVVASSGRC